MKSSYETDIFSEHLTHLNTLIKEKGLDVEKSKRIIAEHGRSASFLIGDGVLPENTGRGYVLRRLIRRAMVTAKKLNLEFPILSPMAKITSNKLSHIYPELDEKFLPQKYNNARFPYFHTLVLDRLNAMYQYEIDGEYYKHDCYPQRTFVGMEMEKFWEVIEPGAIMNFKRDWVKYGEPLVTDDGGLQNIRR